MVDLVIFWSVGQNLRPLSLFGQNRLKPILTSASLKRRRNESPRLACGDRTSAAEYAASAREGLLARVWANWGLHEVSASDRDLMGGLNLSLCGSPGGSQASAAEDCRGLGGPRGEPRRLKLGSSGLDWEDSSHGRSGWEGPNGPPREGRARSGEGSLDPMSWGSGLGARPS